MILIFTGIVGCGGRSENSGTLQHAAEAVGHSEPAEAGTSINAPNVPVSSTLESAEPLSVTTPSTDTNTDSVTHEPHTQLIDDPNNIDEDDDGVKDWLDAFPLDPTESSDHDLDGIGDNADLDDDNDGVPDTVDFNPLDQSCSTEAEVAGYSECVFTQASYSTFTVVDHNNIAYFINLYSRVPNTDVIVRADLESSLGLPSIDISMYTENGNSVEDAIYHSSHERVYVGFSSGEIYYIGPENSLILFYDLQSPLEMLVSVNGNLWAQSVRMGFILNDSGNVVVTTDESNLFQTKPVWSSALNRAMYLFNGRISYSAYNEDSDQFEVHSNPDPKYSYVVSSTVMAISPDGRSVATANGEIFDVQTLEWQSSVNRPGDFVDMDWSEDSFVGISDGEFFNDTIVSRYSHGLKLMETVELPGDPLKLIPSGGGYFILTRHKDQLKVSRYTPSSDTDGDGVLNNADEFPQDPAASVDSDGDGYPDKWNTGYTQSGTHWWRMLDPDPTDAICPGEFRRTQLSCDYRDIIESYWYSASSVVDRDGILHLFLAGSVVQWDADSEQYIGSFNIGEPNLVSVRREPDRMFYSHSQHRLYFAYGNGNITYVSLDDPSLSEAMLVTLPDDGRVIAVFGDYLLAESNLLSTTRKYIVDEGVVNRHYLAPDDERENYFWSQHLQRLYFRENDLLKYHQFPMSGGIVQTQNLFNNAENGWFCLSGDESNVLDLNSGNYYDVSTGAQTGTIDLEDMLSEKCIQFPDGRVGIVGAVAYEGNKIMRIYNNAFVLLGEQEVSDQSSKVHLYGDKLIRLGNSSPGITLSTIPIDY